MLKSEHHHEASEHIHDKSVVTLSEKCEVCSYEFKTLSFGIDPLDLSQEITECPYIIHKYSADYQSPEGCQTHLRAPPMA